MTNEQEQAKAEAEQRLEEWKSAYDIFLQASKNVPPTESERIINGQLKVPSQDLFEEYLNVRDVADKALVKFHEALARWQGH